MQPLDELTRISFGIWTSLFLYALVMTVSSSSSIAGIILAFTFFSVIFIAKIRKLTISRSNLLFLLSVIILASSFQFRSFERYLFEIFIIFSFFVLVVSFFLKEKFDAG
jgi:hypothetical protein